MIKPIIYTAAAFTFACLLLIAFAETAVGTNNQVCAPLSSGKIDTTGDPATVTITATPGFEITSYCVKAGSVKQGDGPVYITVDPPVTTITFGHPSGKDVSHFSWKEQPITVPTTQPPSPTTSTPAPSTTTPVTTQPPATTTPETTVATTVPPTTAPPSTESTVPPSSEPPVEQPTTLPSASSTTPTPPSSPSPTTLELPATGLEHWVGIIVGTIALALGLTALRVARR